MKEEETVCFVFPQGAFTVSLSSLSLCKSLGPVNMIAAAPRGAVIKIAITAIVKICSPCLTIIQRFSSSGM